jgi:RloB-like protein
MPRERREFKRKSFIREVQRLFVIATEGFKTEIRYFEEFKSEQYYNNQSVFVEVLKRFTTDSSPDVVIRQLNSFVKEFRLKESDELWMIIDRDKQSWTQREIAKIARLCIQKGYGFALSNPCFEVWLLLHVADFNNYTAQDQIELFENRKTGNRTRLETELLNICGSYNKANLNASHYLPSVNDAILRAEALVQNANERWPNQFGSHVFKLVRRLMP